MRTSCHSSFRRLYTNLDSTLRVTNPAPCVVLLFLFSFKFLLHRLDDAPLFHVGNRHRETLSNPRAYKQTHWGSRELVHRWKRLEERGSRWKSLPKKKEAMMNTKWRMLRSSSLTFGGKRWIQLWRWVLAFIPQVICWLRVFVGIRIRDLTEAIRLVGAILH